MKERGLEFKYVVILEEKDKGNQKYSVVSATRNLLGVPREFGSICMANLRILKARDYTQGRPCV